MIRVIHGDDEFSISNALESRLNSLGPPDLRAPNVTTFEAPNVPMAEVFAAARILPFLTDRRAIVVKGMLKPLDTRGDKVRADWEKFGDRISDEAMQITNELIFVENVPLRMNARSLKTLAALAEVEEHRVPNRRERMDWLRRRFEFHGVDASASAIGRFDAIGGDDTRRLDSEIQKLEIYANGKRLQPSDIDLMVADVSEDRIFNVMDAIIEGRHRQAIGGVQNLVANGESIEGIFALLTRQVRQLIVAAHMLERGSRNPEVGQRLRMNLPWLVDKTCRQALSVGSARLKAMHLQMLKIDEGVKTGRVDRRLAVEMLVSALAAR